MIRSSFFLHRLITKSTRWCSGINQSERSIVMIVFCLFELEKKKRGKSELLTIIIFQSKYQQMNWHTQTNALSSDAIRRFIQQ